MVYLVKIYFGAIMKTFLLRNIKDDLYIEIKKQAGLQLGKIVY